MRNFVKAVFIVTIAYAAWWAVGEYGLTMVVARLAIGVGIFAAFDYAFRSTPKKARR